MAITTITTPPSRTAGLTQDAFSAAMESTLTTMKQAVDDINANASQYNVATTGTSTSSVLIGTGAKTFTTQSGLGFVVGMTLRIANSSTNFMTGEVTSYSGTSLVMNITSVGGSGTLASWTISMAAVGASTAATVSNTPAGNIAATTVQAAINELDTEKLSSAAGAVTSTNLNSIITAGTIGDSANIPVVTYNAQGRVTATSSAQKVVQSTTVTLSGTTTTLATSIPSTAKVIFIQIAGMSTSGTSIPILRLGVGGTAETTSYNGSGSTGTSVSNGTTGASLGGTHTAAYVKHGMITLSKMEGSNTWAISGTFGHSEAAQFSTVGYTKALAGVLDSLFMTIINGTDTYDGGTVSVSWL